MPDYVPNMLRCAKCNFELERFTMNANTGAIGSGTNEPERCPNGCGPLWRVTWEQEAQYLGKRMNEWADRAIAAEAALKAERERCARIADDDERSTKPNLSGCEVMVDGDGVSLESNKPFGFTCCDCGLTHRCVIVSEDGKPVGFAIERDQQATKEKRTNGVTLPRTALPGDRLMPGCVDETPGEQQCKS